jgi:gliding motility-associated-like protein
MTKTLSYIIAFVILAQVINAQDNPPEINISENQTYCLNTGVPIVNSASITDPDVADTNLDELSIQISEGYELGFDLLEYLGANPNITSSWNSQEGNLTLTGPATFTEFETALLNVEFSTTQVNYTANRSITVNLGNANFLPLTGHYYFYVSDLNVTWQQAKIDAENFTFFGLQGYLATITSLEEALFVGEQSTGTGWIGGSDQQQEGTWIWETGPEQGDVFWIGQVNGNAPQGAFAFWNNNEPNNLGEEDYAHITDPSIGISGAWNDLSNVAETSGPYQAKGYIVEYGGLPGEPEINLSDSSTMIMPQTSAENQEVCAGEILNISINTNADDANWFATQTSTDVINTGLSFSNAFNESTTLWIQPLYNSCSNLVERIPVSITVLDLPEADNIIISQCSDSDSISTAGFALENYVDLIIEGNSANTIQNLVVNFFEDIDLNFPISSEDFTNSENFQVIYAEIFNTQTQCSTTAEVTLEVIFNDLGISEIEFCDQVEENDGITLIDLSQAEDFFLPNPQNNQNVTFYNSLNDALNENNPLPNEFENTIPFEQTVFARVNDENGCLGLGELNLLINTISLDDVGEEVYYCTDQFPDTIILNAGIEQNIEDYFYLWSTNETTNSIEVNEPGQYVVVITDINGCNVEKNFSVLTSSKPIIEDVEVVDFSLNNSLTITTSNPNSSDFEYSLDGEIFQNSNTFNNLQDLEYTVVARDKNGCGEDLRLVFLLDFPKFFTPNGDGFNDLWQLSNSNTEVFTKLFIFNRYGKLLADINTVSDGWDGTFNGRQMPSDDYWFRIEREDGRVFSGNFTLKR